MLYFSSDLHLGDEATIKYDLRPFKNAKQFDAYIIRTFNKQAGKNDTIYMVGDFVDCDGFGDDGWKEPIKLIKKFKAKVILIVGNNEKRIIKYFFDGDFEAFKNYCVSLGFKDVLQNSIISMRDKQFYITHKPIDSDSHYINLFGHTHAAGGIYTPYGINVGCDVHHFRLLSEGDVFHFLEKKKQFWDNDENLNLKKTD